MKMPPDRAIESSAASGPRQLQPGRTYHRLFRSQTTAWKRLAVLLALIAFFQQQAAAQEPPAPASQAGATQESSSADARAERWRNVLEGKAPLSGPTMQQQVPAGGQQMPPPEPPGAVDLADPATMQAYQAALREYYTYLQKGLQHRQKVFVWQHYSSIAIFVVVILLVMAGIYFAAVQFHHGLRRGGSSAETATQFEAGTSGLKVSSPVLGVIILVISLAFFYLYLAFVYPIREIF